MCVHNNRLVLHCESVNAVNANSCKKALDHFQPTLGKDKEFYHFFQTFKGPQPVQKVIIVCYKCKNTEHVKNGTKVYKNR